MVTECYCAWDSSKAMRHAWLLEGLPRHRVVLALVQSKRHARRYVAGFGKFLVSVFCALNTYIRIESQMVLRGMVGLDSPAIERK